MVSTTFNVDYSNDLLAKINPGILLPQNYINWVTPAEFVGAAIGWQKLLIDAADDLDGKIVALYAGLAPLFGTAPTAVREVIQLVQDQPNSYPFILGQDPAGLINSLRRSGYQNLRTFTEITFYFVNVIVYDSAPQVSEKTNNTFVVFHYIP